MNDDHVRAKYDKNIEIHPRHRHCLSKVKEYLSIPISTDHVCNRVHNSQFFVPALDMKTLTFPEGFCWGTATASYQIEGGKGGE